MVQRVVVCPVLRTTRGGLPIRQPFIMATYPGIWLSALALSRGDGTPGQRDDVTLCLLDGEPETLTPVLADPAVIDLLEVDIEWAMLSETITQLPVLSRDRVATRFRDVGIEPDGVAFDLLLQAYIAHINPHHSALRHLPIAGKPVVRQVLAGPDPGDTFVEGSDTTLASHTPTGPDAGLAWTVETGSLTALVNAANDNLVFNTGNSGAVVYTITPHPGHQDQSLEALLVSTTRGITLAERERSEGFVARHQGSGDQDRYVMLIQSRKTSAPPNCVALIAGYISAAWNYYSVGTYDIQDGDTLRFDCFDAAKTGYANGSATGMPTTTNNDITAAGRWGLGSGTAVGNVRDKGSVLDDFKATAAAQTVAVAQATEQDLAQPITWAPKIRSLAQALEADTAQLVGVAKTRAVAQALEADTAQFVGVAKTRAVGQVLEADTALVISTGGQTIGVAQAVEADLARPVAVAPLRRLVATAVEADLAQPITVQGGAGAGGARRKPLWLPRRRG